MSTGIRIDGLDDVLAGLNREVAGVKNRSQAGFKAGGLIIQAEAQRRVPVEYGDLRGSAYTQDLLEGMGVEIGFTVAYALWVHENREVHKGEPRASGLGVYWGPRGEPGFLANAVEARMDQVVRVVAQYAEVRA